MTLEEAKQYFKKSLWTTYNLQPCLVKVTGFLTDLCWVETENDDWLETPSNLYLTKEEAKEAALKEIEEKINKYKKLKQDLLND